MRRTRSVVNSQVDCIVPPAQLFATTNTSNAITLGLWDPELNFGTRSAVCPSGCVGVIAGANANIRGNNPFDLYGSLCAAAIYAGVGPHACMHAHVFP